MSDDKNMTDTERMVYAIVCADRIKQGDSVASATSFASDTIGIMRDPGGDEQRPSPPVQGGYYLRTMRDVGIGTWGLDGMTRLRRIAPDGSVSLAPRGHIEIETGGVNDPTYIVIRKCDEQGSHIGDADADAIDVRELLATPFFKELIKHAQRQVVSAAEHGIGEAWQP